MPSESVSEFDRAPPSRRLALVASQLPARSLVGRPSLLHPKGTLRAVSIYHIELHSAHTHLGSEEHHAECTRESVDCNAVLCAEHVLEELQHKHNYRTVRRIQGADNGAHKVRAKRDLVHHCTN